MKNYHGWKIWLIGYKGEYVDYRIIVPVVVYGQGRMMRVEWDSLPDWYPD